MLKKKIKELKGVGNKTEELLNKLKIKNYFDLISYVPLRYEHFKGLVNIEDIIPNEVNCIRAEVATSPSLRYLSGINLLEFFIKDEKDMMIKVLYFNQPYLKKVFRLGQVRVFSGKVYDKNGQYLLQNPKLIDEQELEKLKKFPLLPIYSTSKGLTTNKVAKLVRQAFKEIIEAGYTRDYLPQAIKEEYKLVSFLRAMYYLHFPRNIKDLEAGRKRFVFDEFLLFQLKLNESVRQREKKKNKYKIIDWPPLSQTLDLLDFELTRDQRMAVEDIREDFSKDFSMNRLLQGDVGSGKTIVAVISAFLMAKNKLQTAFMVPTEVLAVQHYNNILDIAKKQGIRICLLVGSLKASEKKQVYEDIKNHRVDIVIGTHAIIQEKVIFKKLAFVITDEQHRFGVLQRQALLSKGSNPHVLVMSATPIPRTLALMLYRDMDISIIASMPSNRKPIKTYYLKSSYRERIYNFILKELDKGNKAFIICPMIEGDEDKELEGVIEYSKKLKTYYGDRVNLAYMHGKLSGQEKEKRMQELKDGKLDILVSTTVIEVGIDIEEATLILIENAERYGLSQLHQLRGRVGRSSRQSYCIMISDTDDPTTKEKLSFMTKNTSGFDLAEYDLRVRGPGDAFGVDQHGLPYFRMADIYRHMDILSTTRDISYQLAYNEDSKYFSSLYSADSELDIVI